MILLKKEWYKTWWGKTLCILFFYILIPYLVWTQTNWNKYLKIGVTVICFLLFGYVIVTSILTKNLHDKLIKEVIEALDRGDIHEAEILIEFLEK